MVARVVRAQVPPPAPVGSGYRRKEARVIGNRAVAAIVGTAALAALVGCGSGSSSTTTATSQTGGATTVTVTSTTTTPSTSTGGTSTSAGAQNLVVTSALRTELLQAGAASNGVPASGYTGLTPGRTYYAYDPATTTYWAGAQLVPSMSSIKAQVSVQDDGAYLLFNKPAGGTWTVHSVGMTGIGGSTCPVAVPAGVLSVWGWKSGTCRPGG
jgi:hypothetical protein